MTYPYIPHPIDWDMIGCLTGVTVIFVLLIVWYCAWWSQWADCDE